MLTSFSLSLLLAMSVLSTGWPMPRPNPVLAKQTSNLDKQADQIVGQWYYAARDSKIEFFRSNNQYAARITDVGGNWRKNFTQLQGQLVISGLAYRNGEWSGGTFIHPETGNQFDVMLTMKDPATLIVSIYKGMRLVHKDLILTRTVTL
jgi:uncharacterized protein (DUF2147 family)